MIEGVQYQLIFLPAVARPYIPVRLRSAGIDVTPSQKRVPARVMDSGTILACSENKGNAEILIVDEAKMEEQHRSMVAVLIFPGRGSLGDWFHGTTDRTLRMKIHEVLCALKTEIATNQNAPSS